MFYHQELQIDIEKNLESHKFYSNYLHHPMDERIPILFEYYHSMRMIFGTISVIALWRYFTKFLGLSKEMIEEISVNAKIGNLQVNDAYMDFSDLTFRVGGVILFLFVLTSNEIKISKNFF